MTILCCMAGVPCTDGLRCLPSWYSSVRGHFSCGQALPTWRQEDQGVPWDHLSAAHVAMGQNCAESGMGWGPHITSVKHLSPGAAVVRQSLAVEIALQCTAKCITIRERALIPLPQRKRRRKYDEKAIKDWEKYREITHQVLSQVKQIQHKRY